jgi:hypothetical protein
MGQTHNEIYDQLQKEYLKNKDNKVLGKMYEIAKEAAKNYLVKYCRDKGIRLDVNELSHDAALFIIEQYLKKPGFKVDKLSAYIYYGTIKVLFKDKDREQKEVSYEQYIENSYDN